MSRIVGIDLGTTHSLVATVDSGIPMVMADQKGKRLTPSVVYLPDGGGEAVVGHEAMRQALLHPESTFYSVKRFMGRKMHDLDEADLHYPFRFHGNPQDPVQFKVQNDQTDPSIISSLILKKLKKVAEDYLGEEVHRAVITVPAYFNDTQRNATRHAGEVAGFQVERILNEPTAAALAYGLNRLHESSRVAVYDLGGGTFDLSILELREGVFQVLATHGNTHLGGDDIDQVLTLYLVRDIESRLRDVTVADHPETMARIKEAVVGAKIQLSEEMSVSIQLPFLFPDFNYEFELTRETLETLSQPIIEKTRSHCFQALRDAGLKSTDLDQVILVGGQTRMPLVRQFVSDLFSCQEFDEIRGGMRVGDGHQRVGGPVLNTSQNPDEAVALGAAVQAEILSGRLENVLLLDVTPLSLGIETFGGLMNVLIPRNTTIPVKAGEKFTNAVDFQKSMLIHILQGEREKAADNWSLGRFTLDFDPAPKGIARVGVQFEIDADGILHVLVRDVHTGKEQKADIQSVVDVEDEKVQHMVEEAVDFAWEDLTVRRWIEARIKAEENLKLVEAALNSHGDQIDEGLRGGIHDAMEKVRCLCQLNEEEVQGENVKELKEEVERLDEATLPLADLMMADLMEETLRQRGVISD